MLLQTWESADKIVRKDVIKPGKFCRKPTECATCGIAIDNVNVVNASLQDLKERYNSEILNGVPQKSIVIGEGNCEIDRQIERAIQMMFILETSVVTINLWPEGIHKPLTIKFQITLTEMKPYKPIWEWTPEDKYSIALRYKEIGVRLFKQERCIDAFHRFSKACKILITLEPIPDLELDPKLESNINNLRLVLYNNMASCQLKRKNYELAISLCSKILDKEGNNVKALYRRGVAYGSLKDLEKAVADLKNAVTLEPQNQMIKQQFTVYSAKLQEANKSFDNIVRKMFKT